MMDNIRCLEQWCAMTGNDSLPAATNRHDTSGQLRRATIARRRAASADRRVGRTFVTAYAISAGSLVHGHNRLSAAILASARIIERFHR